MHTAIKCPICKIRNMDCCSPRCLLCAMRSRRKPLQERFERRVQKTATCWNWIGPTTPTGYGIMGIDQTSIGAHRLAYELYEGKIPKGMYVCHRCDNPSCVNPRHLFLGTPKDNMTDKVEKHRQYRPIGIRNVKAKLNELMVNEIRALSIQGHSYADIARRYSVCSETIRSVVVLKTWGHV